MHSSRIMVGLPLENPRPAGLDGWRQWFKARREPAISHRPSAVPLNSAASEGTRPALDLEGAPPSLLSLRHFIILSATALIGILLIFGLVRSNHLSLALSYEISSLTQERLTLQEINRQLKTELTGVGSLSQLEEAARNVLGLITPSQGQIVVVEP